MTFSLDYRAHSETGPLRRNNQDSGFASPRLLVVADGMGGAAAGDLASTVAVREVLTVDQHVEGPEMLDVLGDAVARANDHLANLVADDLSLDGMGTTVTSALFSGEQLGIVHIGDSRAYLFRDGELGRITTDHSWVMSLVAEGKISEEEAETHPHRNLLLKVLNGQPTHRPDAFLFDVQLGDRLLFCSDGLCGFAHDPQMRQILVEHPDIDEAMDHLVQAAYQGGGADNITIVLADVVEASPELEQAAPLLVGAAVDTPIPAVPAVVDASQHAEDIDEADLQDEDTPPVVIDPEKIESIRYAPTEVRPRRWVGPVLSTVLVLAALVGVGAAGVAYARTQYYVAADPQQKVAIYNGVPGELLGVKFQRLAEGSDVPVADLPRFYQSRVADTISTGDLGTARRTVAELRRLAAICRDRRAQATATTTPAPTPSPTAFASPSASSSATASASSQPSATNPASQLSQPAATGSPAPEEDC